MRKIRAIAWGGVAALAIAGTAVAANHNRHVMKVNLPDGSVAEISYAGDVAPKVTIGPASNVAPVRWFDPLAAAPFATIDQLAAAMDQQANTIMQQVRALPTQPNASNSRVDVAAFRDLPAGTVSYNFVSTGTGRGTCSRSVEVTSLGPGHPPKVVSTSSGDCQAAPSTPARSDVKHPYDAVAPTTRGPAPEHAGTLPLTT